MNDFARCNKLTGVHWLKENVDNLRIKVKLKPPDDIISLPKFEDYTNETNTTSHEQNIEEFSFKWQEKSFSALEIKRCKDVHTCLTENELKYHEHIKNKEIVASKVFSYIHDDYYMPLPQEKRKNVNVLSSCFNALSLDDAVGRIGEAFGERTVSERHLFKSMEDFDEAEQWTAMHIVFDNSNYNEDTLLIKQEAILLSLYHNTVHNYIILTPDQNNLETNPYVVETNVGDQLGYQYELTVEFGDDEDTEHDEIGNSEELVTLLSKLYNKWEKKHLQLVNFITPPLGINKYYVTIDISTASGFNMENLYIEYDIMVPEGAQCKDTLHGRTHITEPALIDDMCICNYGHLVELTLELDSEIEKSVNIYLEVISVDFWHRHRTEGYAHLPLLLTPGVSSQELRCVRPDEMRGAEDRRFFVGGCHLIKNLEALSRPEFSSAEYTYTETGTIHVRTSTISQSTAVRGQGVVRGLSVGQSGVPGRPSSAAALLRGAEAALHKYRSARARLARASAAPGQSDED